MNTPSDAISINTPSFGIIKLKRISSTSIVALESSYADDNDRDYVVKLLHHLSIGPTIPVQDISRMNDSELLDLIYEYVKRQEDINKYFDFENQDKDFLDIRNGIRLYLRDLIIQISQIVTDGMSPFRDSIQTIATGLAKAFEPIQSEFIKLSYKLAEFGKKLSPALKESIPVLKKHGWYICPSLPPSFFFEIMNIEKSNESEEAKRILTDKLFVDYFSGNNYEFLTDIILNWGRNELFKPRMEVLRDCLSVLIDAQEKYNPANVIIPTLIAQIDGVSIEFLFRTSGVSRDRNGELKRRLTSRLERASYLDKHLLLIAEYFFDVLFQRSLFGEPLQSQTTFSRHKIQHGEFLEYGSIENVIRAFMMLDYLAFATEKHEMKDDAT
jgi:hypothetical protein